MAIFYGFLATFCFSAFCFMAYDTFYTHWVSYGLMIGAWMYVVAMLFLSMFAVVLAWNYR